MIRARGESRIAPALIKPTSLIQFQCEPLEVGVVTDVSVGPLPEDLSPFDQKDTWHQPGIPNGSAGDVARSDRLQSFEPDARADQFSEAGLSDFQALVKNALFIGDRTSLRPVASEELFALLAAGREEEKNGRIPGVVIACLPQFLDRLLAEQSAQMPETDHQGQVLSEFLTQSQTGQVDSLNRRRQDVLGEPLSSHVGKPITGPDLPALSQEGLS